MVGVHAEYIPQTRNFVRIRADSTKSTILRNGIEYGPYSLKKAARHSKKIVEKKDASGSSHDGAADDKKFAFKHNGKDYTVTQDQFSKNVELWWNRILTKKRNKDESKKQEALQQCNDLRSFLVAASRVGLKVDEYECGTSPDQIKKPAAKQSKASKFGGLDGGSHDSTSVPGDTKKSRPTAVSVPVSFDFWFYTGNIKDSNIIKNLAQEEGVFEHDAKVIYTTTTITGSTLCISSLLSTHTDESEHADATVPGGPAATVHFGTINPVDFSGFEATKNRCLITYIASQGSQGSQSTQEAEKAAEEAEEDGNGAAAHEGKDTAVDEADDEADEEADDEADEEADDEHAAATGADDSDPNTKEDPSSLLVSPPPSTSSVSSSPSASSLAPVYIFYTVEPPEGSEGTKVSSDLSKKKKAENTNDGTKKLDTAYNAFKNGPKYSLRSYVPSVLADRVVLDAMMDLVARCVDNTDGYDVSTRAIQTIMLSDVEYVVVTNESATQLVPMEPEKQAKPVPPASASSNKKELDESQASATGDPKLPVLVGTPRDDADQQSPDFGTTAEDFKSRVKAALFAKNDDIVVMRDKESIVSALYDISLDKIGLATFQGLTKNTLVIGNIGNIKLEVSKPASSTRARSDPSDELFMRASVIGDYMVVLTDNQVPGPNRYKAYAFKLKKDANAMNKVFTGLFEEFLEPGKAVKALGAVKGSHSGTSASKIVSSLIDQSTTSTTYITDSDNVHTKIRAIRILLASKLTEETKETKKVLNDALGALNAGVNATVQQTKSAQQPQQKIQQPQAGHVGSSPEPSEYDEVVSNIQKLDELFLQYKLNPEYEWGNNELNEKLNGLKVPVGNYNWHGDRSLQRIVAQYVAFEVNDQFTVLQKKKESEKRFVLFSTGTNKTYTTSRLLEKYNKVDTEKKKFELHENNKALYYTCLFVTALRDQNFGALFTSQPNFLTKPVRDNEPEKEEYDTEFDKEFKDFSTNGTDRIRPTCGESDGGSHSEIKTYKANEATIDLFELDKAVSLVTGLTQVGVLIERAPQKQLLDCKETLEELDKLLKAINPDDIGTYTSGAAGPSTFYTAMLGQSMKCFVLFLPLIERMVRKKHPSENDDFIRSNALSYGCVSHGLDPKHIIAVRYAMINKDKDKDKDKTYEEHSYPLSRKICEDLFGLLLDTGQDSYPVTRELMRTRVLGAITVIEDVKRRPVAKAKFGMRSFV